MRGLPSNRTESVHKLFNSCLLLRLLAISVGAKLSIPGDLDHSIERRKVGLEQSPSQLSQIFSRVTSDLVGRIVDSRHSNRGSRIDKSIKNPKSFFSRDVLMEFKGE